MIRTTFYFMDYDESVTIDFPTRLIKMDKICFDEDTPEGVSMQLTEKVRIKVFEEVQILEVASIFFYWTDQTLIQSVDLRKPI